MTEQQRKGFVRGTVTHVHDRRASNNTVVICIAIEGIDQTESIPVTYGSSGSPELVDLLETAGSVKVGDQVETWYFRESTESPNRATGHSLSILA